MNPTTTTTKSRIGNTGKDKGKVDVYSLATIDYFVHDLKWELLHDKGVRLSKVGIYVLHHGKDRSESLSDSCTHSSRESDTGGWGGREEGVSGGMGLRERKGDGDSIVLLHRTVVTIVLSKP